MADSSIAISAIGISFIVLVCHAILSDLRELVIRNWISVAIVLSFVLYVSISPTPVPWPEHLLVAAAAFFIGFVLFTLRWIAGGDVKLMAALSLWAGPDLILPFALLTTWLGLATACASLSLRWLHTFGEAIGMPGHLRNYFPRWAKRGLVPYGLAIGAAALVVIPVRFF